MSTRRRLLGLLAAVLLGGVGLVATATGASAAPAPTTPASVLAAASGNFHEIVNKAYDQCVDVPGGSTTSAVQLQIHDCNNSGAQAWAPVLVSGRIYNFVNQNSGDCLEVRNDSLLLGKAVQQFPCVGVTGQQWIRTPVFVNGAIWETFTNVHSGLCLDTVGGSGSLLMQWTCQGNAPQYWQVR